LLPATPKWGGGAGFATLERVALKSILLLPPTSAHHPLSPNPTRPPPSASAIVVAYPLMA